MPPATPRLSSPPPAAEWPENPRPFLSAGPGQLGRHSGPHPPQEAREVLRRCLDGGTQASPLPASSGWLPGAGSSELAGREGGWGPTSRWTGVRSAAWGRVGPSLPSLTRASVRGSLLPAHAAPPSSLPHTLRAPQPKWVKGQPPLSLSHPAAQLPLIAKTPGRQGGRRAGRPKPYLEGQGCRTTPGSVQTRLGASPR